MVQWQGTVLRAGSASRTVGRQGSDSLGEIQPARPNTCPEHPRLPLGGNDSWFSNLPRKRPKTAQHHLPPTVPVLSPSTGLTTKVKLLGDVAR